MGGNGNTLAKHASSAVSSTIMPTSTHPPTSRTSHSSPVPWVGVVRSLPTRHWNQGRPACIVHFVPAIRLSCN